MRLTLGLLLFVFLSGPSVLAQQSTNNETASSAPKAERHKKHGAKIEVVGKSIVKDIPEDIIYAVPIKVVEADYLECTDKTNALLAELRSDLVKAGFDAALIKTQNFSVGEEMEYIDGKRRKTGYRATVQVSLREAFKPEKVQNFLTVMNKHQLEYRINFQISQAQREAMKKMAIEEAVKDALDKAKTLTNASGQQLGELVLISYGREQFRVNPILAEQVYAMADDEPSNAGALNLTPDEVSVTQTVLMTWSMEP